MQSQVWLALEEGAAMVFVIVVCSERAKVCTCWKDPFGLDIRLSECDEGVQPAKSVLPGVPYCRSLGMTLSLEPPKGPVAVPSNVSFVYEMLPKFGLMSKLEVSKPRPVMLREPFMSSWGFSVSGNAIELSGPVKLEPRASVPFV